MYVCHLSWLYWYDHIHCLILVPTRAPTPEMRDSTLNKIWCRCFTNVVSGVLCLWGCWLILVLVHSWRGQNRLGNNPESLSQCDHHISNLRHTEPPCKTCPVVPAHYSATPIASLAGSHNRSDARDTGMDAQQLVEFVVDDAPTVVQLLTQVCLLHLYFLSPLILTYI